MDGTGNESFPGTVGIRDGKVYIERGAWRGEAQQTIDAGGNVVCPGFIDLHAHSALKILEDPQHDPKLRQGVTTKLIGVDGNSYAPFRRAHDFADFRRLNAGLDGDVDVDLHYQSITDYLANYDERVAVNICCIVGNSPLRINSV